jgi:hypothetical protein
MAHSTAIIPENNTLPVFKTSGMFVVQFGIGGEK